MANATMHDVAKLAGVSLATVGRVLHQNGYVSRKNREKVEAAVRQLGYIPNSAAQSLKNSSSHMLGHILRFSPNLLFEQISQEVDRAAAQRGYSVLSFTKYESPGEDQRIVTEFISRRVEGVIITSILNFDPALVQKLLDAGIPTVRIERAPEHADRVLVDDLQGAREGAAALVQAGHRDIAYMGLGGNAQVERLRLEGYRQALEEGGLPLCPHLEQLVEDYSPQAGYQAMAALWAGSRPTAVFAAADSLASGALQFLYQAGARVPQDVSFMGYDNTLATLLAPPLDSVGIQAGPMGEAAVDLLLRRRQHPLEPGQPGEEILVPTRLVSRGTVAPPSRLSLEKRKTPRS